MKQELKVKQKLATTIRLELKNELTLKVATRVLLITPIFFVVTLIVEFFLGLGYQKMTIEQPHIWGLYTGIVEELFFILFLVLFHKLNGKRVIGAIVFYRLSFLLIETVTLHATAEEFIFLRFISSLGYKFVVQFTIVSFSILVIFYWDRLHIALQLLLIWIFSVAIHSLYNWSIAKFTDNTDPVIYIILTIGLIGIMILLRVGFLKKKSFQYSR